VRRIARPAYSTLDVFAGSNRKWKGRLSPFVQLLNAGGTRYEEIPGVPMPGRTFLGGIEVRVW
jgi:hypothetical protein